MTCDFNPFGMNWNIDGSDQPASIRLQLLISFIINESIFLIEMFKNGDKSHRSHCDVVTVSSLLHILMAFFSLCNVYKT